MKRIIPIVITTALLLSLAACKSNDPAPSEAVDTPSPSANVTAAPTAAAPASPLPTEEVDPYAPAIVVRTEIWSEEQSNADVDISYPQINCPSDPAFELSTNDTLRDAAMEYLEFFNEMDPDRSLGFGRWSLNISYEEMYNRDEVVSIRIYEREYTGGAHDSCTTTAYTFTRDGGLVTIADLFDADEEAVRASIVGEIQKQIAEDSSGMLYDTAAEDADAYFDWSLCALDAYGVSVVYNEYMLAPYAAGPQMFVVPFDKVAGEHPDWIY